MLTTPTLPGSDPGTSYLVMAAVYVQVAGDSPVSVTCSLGLGGVVHQETVQFAPFKNPEEDTVYMALGSTITAAEAPSLTCVLDDDSSAATAEGAELTATQVATLN